MTTTDTAESHFVTQDKAGNDVDVTFEMIEDESGDTFWGYGHRNRVEFVTEVNRWLMHVGADPEWIFSVDDTPIEHLWVRPKDEHWEHWTVENPFGANSHRWLVPVTRLRG